MSPSEYITEQLMLAHSKEQCDHVWQWVGDDPARFEGFMEVYFGQNPVLRQRAAGVLGRFGRRQASLLEKHLPALIAELDQDVHPALIRNTMRLFQSIDVPASLSMALMEKGFAMIENPQQPVAIRAFSMTVLERLIAPYPELQRELALIVEAHMPEASAAFRVRGRDYLKRMRKKA